MNTILFHYLLDSNLPPSVNISYIFNMKDDLENTSQLSRTKSEKGTVVT